MVRESWMRAILFIAGTISLLIGVAGVFIPVLPTTPLLLLSAACYLRSSKRMYDWLHTNRFFGGYLRNYREGRGLSLRAKLYTIIPLWLTISYSAFYIVDSLMMQLILFIIAILVSAHIILLPTLRKT
jgi:uncharacterized protein